MSDLHSSDTPDPTSPLEHAMYDDTTTVLPTDEPIESKLTDESGTSTSGFHQVNVTHLVMAVAFAGMLAIWGLWALDSVDGSDLQWLLPIPWLVAGAAGLTASILPSRS